jgi:hypothetical protein
MAKTGSLLLVVLSGLTACTPRAPTEDVWQPLVSLNETLPEGISVLSLERRETPMRAWAVLVDESDPSVETQIEMSSDDDRRESAGDFATRLGACVVVNGGYFSTSRTPSIHAGLLLLDDSLVARSTHTVRRDTIAYDTIRGAFGISNEGRPDVAWAATSNDTVWAYDQPPQNAPGEPAMERPEGYPWMVRDAVGAGPVLVQEGRLSITSDEEVFFGSSIPDIHPRTAVGYREDGTVVLLVVDGRQEVSRGASLEELATLMVDLGAREAINLDGGGSSTLVVNGILINRPAGGTYQREIMSAIAVFCDKSS